MGARRSTYRPLFTVLGALAGFIVVGAAATCFVYSAGDPANRNHWLRVTIAAVIGAGVGGYLGETRRQFILNRTAPLAAPLTSIRRALYHNHDRLHFALRLSLAGLVIAAWAFWVVGPDWRLHRIIDRLQSPDDRVSWRASYELQNWDCEGISSLNQERNRMLVPLLSHDRAVVRAAAAWELGTFDALDVETMPMLIQILSDPDPTARATATQVVGWMHMQSSLVVPSLIQQLSDPDLNVRGAAAIALSNIGPAAYEAVPELANLVNTNDAAASAAIVALGKIHSNPEVSLPALMRVYTWIDTSWCANASSALGEFGWQATVAITLLEQELGCMDDRRHRSARSALLKIKRATYQKVSIPTAPVVVFEQDSPDDVGE